MGGIVLMELYEGGRRRKVVLFFFFLVESGGILMMMGQMHADGVRGAGRC